MRLSQLAVEALGYALTLTGDCEIGSISADSREQTEKGLFFCIKGAHFDAHRFAPQAIKNGAVALVVSQLQEDLEVPQLLVSNDRAAMALIARAFYGFADQQLKLIGITGTKGKTTTSYLVKAVLEAMGSICGLIGTTGNMIGSQWMNSNLTTPDPIELHKTLRLMADAGCEYVVMGLRGVMPGWSWCLGLPNLPRSRTFGTWRTIFRQNASYLSAASVSQELTIPQITYAICTNADLFARDIQIEEGGVSFMLSLWKDRYYPVRLHLMGMFNIYNAIAAAGIGLVVGADPETICRALGSVTNVPGRAEVLDTHTEYKVVLDYSHSPDALENILTAIREFNKGRLIVVFGCGGDRDQSKRPVMGAIAGRLADLSILTSDNPRAEDPLDILGAIEEGIKPTGGRYEVIENRREAIKRALRAASPGDVVLLAGKGHETYQEIAGVKRPFDEKVVVSQLLEEMMAEDTQHA